jgi:DNA-directed RNA polymerase
MAVAVREAFCEIYEKDVLANWAKEMHDMLSEKNQRKFPKLPPKGRLDLALVKKSIFFCI